MSDSLTKLAAKLADDTLALQAKTGEDRLFIEMGSIVGAASQTLEEAFLTECRIRLAEVGGRKFLERKAAEHAAKVKADAAPDA